MNRAPIVAALLLPTAAHAAQGSPRLPLDHVRAYARRGGTPLRHRTFGGTWVHSASLPCSRR